MTNGFIKKNLSTIKELLISNGLVDENWEPGEIYIIDNKWGGFKNDYFRISFYNKWVWENEFGSKNCKLVKSFNKSFNETL
jgi:hypothetical protein